MSHRYSYTKQSSCVNPITRVNLSMYKLKAQDNGTADRYVVQRDYIDESFTSFSEALVKVRDKKPTEYVKNTSITNMITDITTDPNEARLYSKLDANNIVRKNFTDTPKWKAVYAGG